jgi:hypothetical protein
VRLGPPWHRADSACLSISVRHHELYPYKFRGINSSQSKPGTVVHTYNPSYSEGRNEMIVFQVQPGQKLLNPISTKKLGLVKYIYNPSYARYIGRRIIVQSQPREKSMRPYLKNN